MNIDKSMLRKKHNLTMVAYEKILSDVEWDRQKSEAQHYLGSRESIKKKRNAHFVHPLEWPGQKGVPNKPLILKLAERCALWLFDPDRPLGRLKEQLEVVAHSSFLPFHVKEPCELNIVLSDLGYLRDRMPGMNPGQEASCIYSAALILLDTLRMTQPPSACREISGSLFQVMEKAFRNLRWGVDETQSHQDQQQDCTYSLYTIIQEYWNDKKLTPYKVDMQRASHRVGVLMGIEKPLKDIDGTGVPGNKQLTDLFYRRYSRRTPVATDGVSEDERPIQASIIVGDEFYTFERFEAMRERRKLRSAEAQEKLDAKAHNPVE